MPIDPRIPLMGLTGESRSSSPMATLAQLFALRNQVNQTEGQEALAQLRQLQALQTAQQMQLAAEKAGQERTTFGQSQRTYEQTQAANRAVGSVPDLAAISDDLWATIMADLDEPTRVIANTLRADFRGKIATASKAEADAEQTLTTARKAKLEAAAGFTDGVQQNFGADPAAFQIWARQMAEAYPKEYQQYLPLVQIGLRDPSKIPAVYRLVIQAARPPQEVGTSIMDQFGARATAPPPALGPFQLGGAPGTVETQFDAKGQPIATVRVPQTADQQTAGSGGGKAGVDMSALPLKEQVWINNAVSAARGIDNKNSQIAAMKTAIEADTAAGDPNRPNFKRAMRLAAAENLPAATERVRVNQRSEMLNASRAMQDALTKLKARGVNTNILSGSVESVARALGTTTDPELVSLRNELMLQLQAYMNAVTGASYTDKEHARFVSMFPNWQNQNAVNQALLSGLINAHTRQDWEFWSNKFGAEGATFLGAKPPGDTTDNTTTKPAGGGIRIRSIRKK